MAALTRASRSALVGVGRGPTEEVIAWAAERIRVTPLAAASVPTAFSGTVARIEWAAAEA